MISVRGWRGWAAAVILGMVILGMAACVATAQTAGEASDQGDGERKPPRHVELVCPQLTESSGVAFSGIDADCLWSHNDSGDLARVFAFQLDGQLRGRLVIDGVEAIDWEDMDCFRDGRPRMLIADIGDNQHRRSSVSLYLFDEPDPKRRTRVTDYQELVVTFPDNRPQNCEAVAVDVDRRRILMLSKSALMATLFEVPLPKPPVKRATPGPKNRRRVEAQPICKVAVPLATGMALCESTGDLWICSYLHAFRYPASPRETLTQRLKRTPVMVKLPKLKQIEAIAADHHGRVWVTSEGVPAVLQRLGGSDR